MDVNTKEKEYVYGLLERYQEDTRKVEALRYELAHPKRVTSDEMIESMNFGHTGDGGPAAKGHISNKTLYIAANYMDRADVLNAEASGEVIDLLCAMEDERKRLLHYVSLLDEKDGTIIRASYMELKSREELSEMFGVSTKSISTMRKQAVDRLCALYDFTAKYQK